MKSFLRSIYYKVGDRLVRAYLAGKSGTAAEAIAVGWGYRRKPSPHIMTTRNGIRMHFDDVDYIPLLLDYLGSFEQHCLDVADVIIRQAQCHNSLILDIGGNIGTHTLQFAHSLGPSGIIVTVEAMPTHSAAIARNLALNSQPMAQVDIRNIAVGANPGRLSLSLPTGGNGGCYTAGSTSESVNVFDVPMTTIDTIMAEYQDRTLVLCKMDIEGSEFRALLGAKKTIDQSKPPILIEINEDALKSCGSSSTQLKEFFNSCGYEGFLIDRTKNGKPYIQKIPSHRKHKTDEVLFIHSSKVAALLEFIDKQSIVDVHLKECNIYTQ